MSNESFECIGWCCEDTRSVWRFCGCGSEWERRVDGEDVRSIGVYAILLLRKEVYTRGHGYEGLGEKLWLVGS